MYPWDIGVSVNHRKIRPVLKEGSDKEDYTEDDIKGYHMTNRKKSRIYPVGECTNHEPHDTKEEAAKCYEDYILDRDYNEENWSMNEFPIDHCDECGKPAKFRYWSPTYSPLPPVVACEEHADMEIIEKEFSVTKNFESWGSY